MAVRRSAGILLVRAGPEGPELLLAHPGGPFWAKKDDGAWSIPKGEYAAQDDALLAARREFREELGSDCPAAKVIDLGEITQAGGKHVRVWCGVGEIDTTDVHSNTFEIEWPPRTGRLQRFPEVDRVGWFDPVIAQAKLVAGQVAFVDRALRALIEDGLIDG
jgi:predicted NUDIX family NTP pyrophosphohydrolase